MVRRTIWTQADIVAAVTRRGYAATSAAAKEIISTPGQVTLEVPRSEMLPMPEDRVWEDQSDEGNTISDSSDPYKDFPGAFFEDGQDAVNLAGSLSIGLNVEVATIRISNKGGGFLVLPLGDDCDYARVSFSYINSNGCKYYEWEGSRYEFDAMAHTHLYNSYPSTTDQIYAGKMGIPNYIICPNIVFVTTGIGQYSQTNLINFIEP